MAWTDFCDGANPYNSNATSTMWVHDMAQMLYELCTAHDERAAAALGTKTTWNTVGASPALADFDGVRLSGTVLNALVTQLRAAPDTDSDVYWATSDYSALLSAGTNKFDGTSYGAAWLELPASADPPGWLNPNIWHQLREVIEAHRYVWTMTSFLLWTRTRKRGIDAVLETAWDNVTPESFADGDRRLGISISKAPFGGDYYVYQWNNLPLVFPATGGVPDGGSFTYQLYGTTGFGDPITVSGYCPSPLLWNVPDDVPYPDDSVYIPGLDLYVPITLYYGQPFFDMWGLDSTRRHEDLNLLYGYPA